MRERLIVFRYNGSLAYATEHEYNTKAEYMYCVLPDYRDFDEVKDYLETVCNYDNMIVDKTEDNDDDN